MNAQVLKSKVKKFLAYLTCNWVLVWLIIACLSFVATVTYAAYTHSNYTKRVVTINGGGGLQFSSDNLRAVTKSDSPDTENRPRYVYYTENTDPEIAFTVCNYPQNSAASVNPQAITYTLTAEIYSKSDGTKLTSVDDLAEFVGEGDDFDSKSCYIKYNGTEYSLIGGGDLLGCEIANQKLAAATATTHSYTLHLDSRLAENIGVFIVAKPDTASDTAAANQMLCRKFLFSKSTQQSTSWTGEFTDEEIDNEKYYGYNYNLHGTAQETKTLIWNTEKLQLSKLSLALLGKQDVDIVYSDGTAELTLNLGSADEDQEVITSYDLQFYRTSTNTATGKPDSDWVTLK